MKFPLHLLSVLLLSLIPLTLSALLANPISLSTQTQFNLTSSTYTTFFLPSSEYVSTNVSAPIVKEIYITLSLCLPPDSIRNNLKNQLPNSLYLTNSTSFTLSDQRPVLPLIGGFSNFTIDLMTGAGAGAGAAAGGQGGVTNEIKQQGIYFGVLCPNSTALGGGTSNSKGVGGAGDIWNWEITISSNLDNLNGGGILILDQSPSFKFEDSDNTTALITTTNYTDPSFSSTFSSQGDDTSPPNWKPLVRLTTPLSLALSRSFCAISNSNANGAGLIESRNIVQNVTTRGYDGGERLQFELKGLESDKNYTAWLVEDSSTNGGGGGGGKRLWEPIYFKTKLGTSCRLVHSIPFCPNVAYSVPSPPTLSTSSLISFYNDTIQPSLASFARTLSTFPCDSIEMGSYSFISNCEDCKNRYLDWICAVTLPRCDDAPLSILQKGVNETNTTEWNLPDTYQQVLLRDNPLLSRTPLFSPSLLSSTFPSPSTSTRTNLTSPFPYLEIPPCLSLCSLVKAQCPNLIQWGCPSTSSNDGGTGTAAYGILNDIGIDSRMAGDAHGMDLEGDKRGRGRSGDRWGGVYCNSLGTDMLMAAQFSSASKSVSGSGSIVVIILILVAAIL